MDNSSLNLNTSSGIISATNNNTFESLNFCSGDNNLLNDTIILNLSTDIDTTLKINSSITEAFVSLYCLNNLDKITKIIDYKNDIIIENKKDLFKEYENELLKKNEIIQSLIKRIEILENKINNN